MAEALDKITLTSPSGDVFNAKWIGNAISIKKKVATFEYPDVNGATTQDLGLASQSYPLDIYFDGLDHEKEVQNFQVAMLERGVWSVNHPVYGVVKLQPLTMSVEVQPVINRTVTVVSTTWVRATPSDEYKSYRDYRAPVIKFVKTVLDDVSEKSSNKFIKAFLAVKKFLTAVSDTIKKGVRTFIDMNNKVRKLVANKIAALDKMINGTTTLIKTAISAVNSILQIVANVKGYVTTKISLFSKIGKDIRDSIESDLSSGIITTEVARANDGVMAGVLAAQSTATTSGTVLSREESIEIGNTILSDFVATTTLSDEVSKGVVAKLSKDDYFGNLSSYDAIKTLVGVTIGYIIDDTYSNKIKKIITLDRAKATIDVAISEYPKKSVDEAYDFFVDTNQLTGDDIITLQAGRRVVAYV